MWTTSANNNRQQQNSTEARNGGNMASLKNKITHRKRKSAKNQQPTPAQPEKLSENNKATESSPTCNSYNKSKVPSSDSLPRKANGVTRKNSTTDAKCKKTTTGNNSFKGNNGSMRRSKNEPVPSGPDLIRDLNQPKLTTDAVGSDVTDCAAVHAHGSCFVQLITVL